MGEVELRYRGELLGFHADESAARAHAQQHHGMGRAPGPRADHHVEDVESLTIEPRRPVELYCRGNLVETFLTAEGASAYAVKQGGDYAAWLVVDTQATDNVSAMLEAHAASLSPAVERDESEQWIAAKHGELPVRHLPNEAGKPVRVVEEQE